MSGAAFEGLPRQAEVGGEYEPGVVGFGRDLVERVTEYYMDEIRRSAPVQLGDELGFFRKHLRAFGRMLGDVPPERFNANLFLDAVMSSIDDRLCASGSEDHLTEIGALIDPLVQYFYRKGHNDFVVDFREMEKHPLDLGSSLRGTKKRPLGLTCYGNLLLFGKGASNCALALEGDAYFCGFLVDSCDIRVSGKAEYAATYATGSTFTFANHKSIYFDDTNRKALPDDCTFYITKELTRAQQYRIKKGGLFSHGNRVFHQPDEGAWEELYPRKEARP